MLKKSAESVNILYSKGKTELNSGKMTLGSSIDHNSKLNNIVAGSAYTQGNVIRSLFDLNSNGPLLYDSTEDDNLKTIRNNINIFETYPTLVDFPFLSDTSSYDGDTVTSNSKKFPVFKVPGKGKGNIEWYNSGSSFIGNESETGPNYLSFYRNLGLSDQPESKSVFDFIFPFSGKNYSGTMVQITTEQNDNSPEFKNVKVVPYQMGRGIPQYDPSQPYFGGNPYGIPKWESGENILPQLSMGAVPGNNNASIGIILDTERVPGMTEKIYNYEAPTEILNSNWETHASPFTLVPNSNSGNVNGIYSSSNSTNNSSGVFAPWSSNYSYKPNDPVPVLTRGQSTLRIGAAYNIGMQAYYEPEIDSGDDPLVDVDKYVSIPIVPLFQGEELNIGSYVYASVMGHVITYEQEGLTPYPPAIQYDLEKSTTRDAKLENPWYDWYDPTGGAVGWTGTPQFQLAGIPDEGVAIIQAKNGFTLPFLNQANQGSLIVHPISTANPADSVNGSGRMTLIGPPRYEQVSNCEFTYMTKFPGAPERSQPVGNSLECISGSGRWTYSGGAILDAEQVVTNGGAGYVDSYNVETYNSTKNNLVVEIEILNGSLVGVPSSVGSGSTVVDYNDYPRGTVFTIFGTGASNEPHSVKMLISVDSNDGAVITFSVINSGSGYNDTSGVPTLFNTLNLELVNPVVDIVTDGSGTIVTVSIRDFGTGNVTGNVISVLPLTGGGEFTLDAVIDSYGSRRVKGGRNYSIYNPTTPVINEVVDDSGTTVVSYEIDVDRVNGVIPGTLSSIQTNIPSSPVYSIGSLDITTFTLPDVSTGDILTFEQNVVRNDMTTAQANSGLPVNSPVSGWDSYVFSRNATFKQTTGKNVISIPGTGYEVGDYVASNGSETFDVRVYSVNPNAGGEVVSVSYYGPTEDGYPMNTTYTILGGNNDAEITLAPLNLSSETFGPASFLTNRGSGYSTGSGISTYNLSSNSLFVFGEVDNPAPGNCTVFEYNPASLTGEIEMPLRDDGSLFIDLSRYEVGDSIQFNQDSASITGTFTIDSIDVAQSIMTLTQTDFGTLFVIPPNSNYAWFPTRNLTETDTTVDIVADANGEVTGVSIATIGNRLRYGDYLLVESGNENFIFQFRPELNVSPMLQPEVNNRSATFTEWNEYRTVMKTAVNLLNESLIINFNPMYPNYFNNSWYWYGDGGKTYIGT